MGLILRGRGNGEDVDWILIMVLCYDDMIPMYVSSISFSCCVLNCTSALIRRKELRYRAKRRECHSQRYSVHAIPSQIHL